MLWWVTGRPPPLEILGDHPSQPSKPLLHGDEISLSVRKSPINTLSMFPEGSLLLSGGEVLVLASTGNADSDFGL